MKSNIYTRTGDSGTTSLVGGERVEKHHPRLEAYGNVDELNSWIGLLATLPTVTPDQRATLTMVQNRLFDIGAALATEATSHWQPDPFPQAAIDQLEQAIDTIDSTLPRHNRFILPGGTTDAAFAHIARTVARRAERSITALSATDIQVDQAATRFVNRLSDYLFVLARDLCHRSDAPEIFWEK